VSSISFERAAEFYDRTRGGLERGRRFAETIAEHLGDAHSVLEIGVGTVLIALPLHELGYDVFGVDLAHSMLELARSRIGARVAQADAAALPVSDASFDAAVAVWVLHVAGDREGVLRAVARVLRPNGRLIVVCADANFDPDDIIETFGDMRERLGRTRDLPQNLIPIAAGARLHLTGTYATQPYEHDATPEEAAEHLEKRLMSSLWDLDDDTWNRVVQPVIDGLRALPNPTQPRRQVGSHPILVFEPIQ
jgi:ubiquinone/menaquinone biosynthesis C-methylase UbiE